MTGPLLLEARGISRHYPMGRSLFGTPPRVTAVEDVTITLRKGETLGIVGESGSGKSTTGRMLLGIEPPDTGDVRFARAAMPARGSFAWRAMRPRLQMIFQDPLAALDPRLTILSQIREPLDIHIPHDGAANAVRVAEVMEAVGLSAEIGSRYPHELSGGQRQRAVLARALATRPDLLVCDEPVSALDVSIQAQVMNLLADVQEKIRLAMVFISHDLRVVRQVSHRVAVMYLGRIVEEGETDAIFAAPAHPYTQALVSAAPVPGVPAGGRMVLQGETPDPAQRPKGCVFHPRCPVAADLCRKAVPELLSTGAGRRTACHRVPAHGAASAGVRELEAAS